ncbi:MAG: dTDP-4-dehydrorhamnose reductase [Patescibacteria group bacterium]|jgi:dTDP-4-dehydrorhamnose reductase
MKVLIFGAKGNLGQELVSVFAAAGHRVVALDREDLDVLDTAALRRRILDEHADAILNAVAWNDVDGAEDPAKRPLAFKLNAEVPGVMAAAAAKTGALFVHYSTDYVFAGTKPEGYAEDDAPDPISAYGESKLAGEKAVWAASGRLYICRLSKIFGRPGVSDLSKPSFVSIMLKLAATKPELAIVDEEVGCPTYTRDIAAATECLLARNFPPGIYHLVNAGPGVTWYGFAEEFFGLRGVQTPRKPVSAALFPKPAQRPKFAMLLNTKFPPLRQRLAALRDFFEANSDLV